MGASDHSPSTKTPASPALIPALKAILGHRGVQAAAALWAGAYFVVIWLAQGTLPFDRPAVAQLPFALQIAAPSITLLEIFVLMWLGTRANSQPALPAFILGLAMSGHYASHRLEQERLRVVAFAFLTPFFFLKGGMNVSTSALWANLGVLALLFAGKMIPKFVAVYPLARRYTAPHAMFTTLLMSTGLTFGTITSLYGLSAGIIDRTQFSLLIGVVVLSAIIPTVIAQRLFAPRVHDQPIAALPPTTELI